MTCADVAVIAAADGASNDTAVSAAVAVVAAAAVGSRDELAVKLDAETAAADANGAIWIEAEAGAWAVLAA